MKKNKFIYRSFLACLTLIIAITSCSDSDEFRKVDPKIEIQGLVTTTAMPAREVVEFVSSYPWYAEATDNWIQLSKYRGQALKKDSLIFICDENPEMENREGWIEIRLMDQMIQKLKVVQQGRGTLITLPKNMVYFNKQGGDAIIEVLTNLDWQPEVASKDGFSFSKVNDKQLKVSAEPNTTGGDKTVSIKIIDKGKTVDATLNVVQKNSDNILFISLDDEAKDPVVKKDATSILIPATLNIEYECVLSHNWMSIASTTEEEGANFKEIKISVDLQSNETGVERDGYVVIKGIGENTTTSDTLFVSQMGKAKRVYVKPGGTGDGTTWNLAFGSIHDAMAISGHDVDHEIWVAAGNYQFTKILTWNGVNVYGGFLGHENKFKQRDLKNKPVFRGGKFQFMNAWNVSSGKLYWMDGIVFADCDNIENTSVGVFEIYQRGFRNCEFKNLKYGRAAGGYYNNCTIVNCLYQDIYSGQFILRTADTKIYNVTVVNNTSKSGHSNFFQGSTKVYNSIFWGNKINDGAKEGQLYLEQSIDFFNCAVMGDLPKNMNNTDGFSLDRDNNSPTGPNFVNPTGNNMDFSLKASSPCIDKGNSSAYNYSFDIIGNSRVSGASIDIGAYEYKE